MFHEKQCYLLKKRSKDFQECSVCDVSIFVHLSGYLSEAGVLKL